MAIYLKANRCILLFSYDVINHNILACFGKSQVTYKPKNDPSAKISWVNTKLRALLSKQYLCFTNSEMASKDTCQDKWLDFVN